MDNSGWIKIHRKLSQHWVWDNPIHLMIWIYCLIRANYKETEVLFDGKVITLGIGEFVTSLGKMAKECHCTIQQLRTFLKLAYSSEMLQQHPNTKSTRLTVINYKDYQDTITQSQHKVNTKITTDKELKNKELKNNTFSVPTLEEIKQLFIERKYINPNVSAKDFFNYHNTGGWMLTKTKPIKDWKSAASTWNSNAKKWNKYPGVETATKLNGVYDSKLELYNNA